MAAADGGIVSFGNAPYLGSAVGLLHSPVVGIATVVAGGYEGGYVVGAADGATVTFMPDERPAVSAPPPGLDGAVVGLGETDANAGGDDLVTAKGQVVPDGPIEQDFGDPSATALAAPVVAGSGAADGYYLVAADGGVFTFGGAPFYGSAANDHLEAPIVGITLADGA